uniref:Glycosyl transferase family 25 domain-containing protein n=1 Tax=Eptatretus burgeri TaxID=7764 RepID=A0A8C4WZZ5_EPTBU
MPRASSGSTACLAICTFLLWTLRLLVAFNSDVPQEATSTQRQPRTSGTTEAIVMVVLVVRNGEHSLPHVLGALEGQRYPRRQMAFWIATDHNEDNTSAVLSEWVHKARALYLSVTLYDKTQPRFYVNEWGSKHWTAERYETVMRLRQEALNAAHAMHADYVLFVDSDNVLSNRETIQLLMDERLPIVSPMLSSRTTYSNFWSAINADGTRKRSMLYMDVRKRKRIGCFCVPLVHSTFLLDVTRNETQALAFYPPHPSFTWTLTDLSVFTYSCFRAEMKMYICNKENYGWLPVPLKPKATMEEELDGFQHVLLEIMVEDPPALLSQLISLPQKPPDRMGFDEVYLINLKRREQRRRRMLNSLAELQLAAKIVEAVDGKALNDTQLQTLGVEMLPEYRDPFSDRNLTRGEIGCFLSHYNVWKEVLLWNLRQVLVLEDDCRFEISFRSRLQQIMDDLATTEIIWDLIYIGRKRVQPLGAEQTVKEIPHLVYPGYSYWTLGYALSFSGALKLVRAQPLGHMLPVDEFLPVMYDAHPEDSYKQYFEPRDLEAFSAEPLLLQPTHFADEAKYISDTETSEELSSKFARGKGSLMMGSRGSRFESRPGRVVLTRDEF